MASKVARDQEASRRQHEQTLLRRLYDSPVFSDVTICFGTNDRVRAHKNTLSFHSAFFEKAFMGEFKEASTNELWLHDDDPVCVYIMLKYIYGNDPFEDGMIPDTPSLKFFTTACKYHVDTLITRVIEVYRQAVNSRWEDCVEEFPSFARSVYEEIPGDPGQIKIFVLHTCRRNIKELMRNEEFKQVLLDVPELSLSLMGHLVSVFC